MQNHVNTHPPTPKKTREVGGIAFGPKEVKSLHPGVALCYAVHPPALSIEKEGDRAPPSINIRKGGVRSTPL